MDLKPLLQPTFNQASNAEIMEYLYSFLPYIKARFESLFPGPIFVTLTSTNSGPHLFIKDREDTCFYDDGLIIEKKIDLRTLDAQNGVFRLNKNLRHQGLGKRLMFAHLETLKDIGLKGCRIYAGDSRGAYTWAKFGFENVGEAIDGHCNDGIEKRLAIISDFFEIQNIDQISKLAASVFTNDIRMFAGLRTSLTLRYPDAAENFKIFISNDIQDSSFPIKDVLRNALTDIFTKYGSIDYSNFPIGEFLMQEMSWHGYFDLNNQAQWDIARAATFPEFKI